MNRFEVVALVLAVYALGCFIAIFVSWKKYTPEPITHVFAVGWLGFTALAIMFYLMGGGK